VTAFDSADLLAQLADTLNLPTTREVTDPQLYTLLSNGQRRVMQQLAMHVPHSNYLAPELMTTTDSGATYTFLYYPMGHAEIRESRDGLVLYPVSDWDDYSDGYVMEGQTIRWPNGRTRTFSAGPYARYVRVPDVISASVEPILKPVHGRMAIVYDAASEYAMQGGLRDPSAYLLQLQRLLWGDANTPGHLGLIPTLKTQYAYQGMTQAPQDAYWWRAIR
jgi:hypothetical protein